MFATILGRAKAAVGDAVDKQLLRVAILVPIVIGGAYALAGVTALLTEQFGRSYAYWMMAAGLGALGAVAAIVVFVRERTQERKASHERSPFASSDLRSVRGDVRPGVSDSVEMTAQPLTILGVLRAAVSD